MNIACAVRAGCVKKKKRQYRTGQEKSHKRVIFHLFGEKSPLKRSTSKIYVVDDLVDVEITCAKFQNEIFRGYDFAGGRIFHFLIDF